jgi:hypothetical protein
LRLFPRRLGRAGGWEKANVIIEKAARISGSVTSPNVKRWVQSKNGGEED